MQSLRPTVKQRKRGIQSSATAVKGQTDKLSSYRILFNQGLIEMYSILPSDISLLKQQVKWTSNSFFSTSNVTLQID